MAQFNFSQDIKLTIWQRQHFTVEADSYEDAVKQAMEFKDRDVSVSSSYSHAEYLEETEEVMYPLENNGCSTIQIFNNNDYGYPIAENSDIDSGVVVAECDIQWNDTKEICSRLIQISGDLEDPKYDDQIFFYCNGFEELWNLKSESNGGEFVVLKIKSVYNLKN